MERSPEHRITDMVMAIDRCLEYLPYLAAQDDTQNRMARDAILRNLTVLGDASRSLPPCVTDHIPTIPWTKIRAVRNLVVHEYFRVDVELIIDIVDRRLPPVLTRLLKMAYSHDLEPGGDPGSGWARDRFLTDEATWVYWSHLDYLSWAERAHGEQIARRERARILSLVEDELDRLLRVPWRIVYSPVSMRDPDSDYQTLSWAQADLGTSKRYARLWELYYAKRKHENAAWIEEYAQRRAVGEEN